MVQRQRIAFAALAIGLMAAAASASLAKTPRHDPRGEADLAAPMDEAHALAAADASVDAALVSLPSLDPPAPAHATLPASRRPSGLTAQLADWIVATDDNAGHPFMIVDKLDANVFAYDENGQLIGHAPVLVGLARGDDSAPGVGTLRLSAIAVDDRTTPAGRFMAHFGPSDHGEVLWVDDVDAISMHPVITTNPAEHRLERIRSASPDEHRISFGCINVPAKFYADVVKKAFEAGGVVYVLPDTKAMADVFPDFVAASFARDDAGRASRDDRCGDPLADLAAGIPDPDPAGLCRAGDDRRTRTAAR
jgi:hypothetical protein